MGEFLTDLPNGTFYVLYGFALAAFLNVVYNVAMYMLAVPRQAVRRGGGEDSSVG